MYVADTVDDSAAVLSSCGFLSHRPVAHMRSYRTPHKEREEEIKGR